MRQTQGGLEALKSFIDGHGCQSRITYDFITFTHKENPNKQYTAATFEEAKQKLGYKS